jgi:hypothetical protein
MKRHQMSGLLILAFMACFWAHPIIDPLMSEFSRTVTYRRKIQPLIVDILITPDT